MKWFKHDAAASLDAKLKRVRIKYGMEGYGLYWYCLEMIAQGVEKHNLTFELEHDAEVIAHDTNIHVDRINDMLSFMCNLGLFEQTIGGVITCMKMATRTDEYTQKLIKTSPDIVMLSRQCPDTIATKSELIEEKRREEKRDRATSRRFIFKPPKEEEVARYIREKRYRCVDAKVFVNFYESKGWMIGKNKMKDWRKAVSGWETRNAKVSGKQDHSLGAL